MIGPIVPIRRPRQCVVQEVGRGGKAFRGGVGVLEETGGDVTVSSRRAGNKA